MNYLPVHHTIDMRDTIYNMDALSFLRALPSNYVQCCVTSPPYYGLRDYGVDGQLGLEPTLQEYIQKLVAIFSELRRVLKDDGTVWLNLGDSFFGSSMTGSSKRLNRMFSKSSNAQHVVVYDTYDKVPVNYQDRDCLCENLCDVCRVVYHHKSHTYDLLVPMLIASLPATIRERMESEISHLPTSDLIRRVIRILNAIPGLLHFSLHDDARLHAFRDSTPDEFSRRLLDLCLQRGNRGECLFCSRSLIDDASYHARTSHDSLFPTYGNLGNISPASQQGIRNLGINKVCEYCNHDSLDSPYDIQPYCTTKSLKPKDLMLVPHRVAIALQDAGWWCRMDNVWHKVNPMPESVKDRPTKAHEYVFLLTKSARYYYDQDAVRESYSDNSHGGTLLKYIEGTHRKRHQLQNAVTSTLGGNGNDYSGDGKNKRSVWSISTTPFTGWEGIDHLRRVSLGDVCDGTIRIASKDCSIHGLSDRHLSKHVCDEREASFLTHILDRYNRHAQGQSSGFVPIDLTHALGLQEQNSDSLPVGNSQTAIEHNNQIHKKDRVLETNPPCMLCAQKSGRIADTQGLPVCAEPENCNFESNTLKSDLGDDHLQDQTSRHNIHIVSSEKPPLCTCLFYNRTTEKQDHFAVMPPDIPDICIRAGSRIGDTVLDMFFGAGTVGLVAKRLNRHYIGSEINPEYVALAEKRIANDWEAHQLPLFADYI